MLQTLKEKKGVVEVEIKELAEQANLDELAIGERVQVNVVGSCVCDYLDVVKETETTFLIGHLYKNEDGTLRNYEYNGEEAVVVRLTLTDEALEKYLEWYKAGDFTVDYERFEAKRTEDTLFVAYNEAYSQAENPYYEVV